MNSSGVICGSFIFALEIMNHQSADLITRRADEELLNLTVEFYLDYAFCYLFCLFFYSHYFSERSYSHGTKANSVWILVVLHMLLLCFLTNIVVAHNFYSSPLSSTVASPRLRCAKE